MVDKFRKTAPIKITFAQSEQPTAEKMSALSIQARNGLKLLEKAVGDIWNQSGDSLLHEYPLQISNLARIIGEQKYLNPAIYPLQYAFRYREVLGTKYRGYTYGYLKFKPASVGTFSFYNNNGQFSTFCANEYDVDGTGEYFISRTNGKWRTNDELLGGGSPETVEYPVDPYTDWLSDARIFPSIIPDPRHIGATFTGCRLSKVSGHYYLYLPPRRPIAFAWDWGSATHGKPSQYPDDADVGLAYGNEATTLDINNLRYWQSDTVNAMAHKHYRYALPLEIYNLHPSMGLGTEYPANTIYLWDQTEQTILEGVVFRKPYDAGFTDQPWVVEISSSNTELSLDDYLSSPDNESHTAYDSTGLTLITCGSSITRSLYTLSMQFLQHKHDGANVAMDTHIDHKNLAGHNPPKDSSYTHNGRYPSAIPAWPQSRYLNDDHTYLLSRTGSQGIASGDQRDENDNAMLGNLVLGNSVADTGGVFLNDTCADNSFKLAFGSNAGPYIRGESSSKINIVTSLILTGPTTASGTSQIVLGANATGDRIATLDFVAQGTYPANSYDLRISRNLGVNGNTTIQHNGTGNFNIFQLGASSFNILTNSLTRFVITSGGDVGIGGTPLTLAGTFLAAGRELSMVSPTNYGPAIIKLGNATPATGNGVIELGGMGFISSESNSAMTGVGVNLVGQYNGTSQVFVTPITSANYGYRGMFMGFNNAIRWYQSLGATTAGATITPTQVMSLDTSGQLGIGPVQPQAALDINRSTPMILVRDGVNADQDAVLKLGYGGATVGGKHAYIDFTVENSVHSDYALRIQRTPGVNGNAYIYHKGTGDFILMNETETGNIILTGDASAAHGLKVQHQSLAGPAYAATIIVGENAGTDGFNDRTEALIVRSHGKPQMIIEDMNSSPHRRMSLYSSSGDGYITNANEFMTSGDGYNNNNWMIFGGQSGIKLNYGNANTNQIGTTGLMVDGSTGNTTIGNESSGNNARLFVMQKWQAPYTYRGISLTCGNGDNNIEISAGVSLIARNLYAGGDGNMRFAEASAYGASGIFFGRSTYGGVEFFTSNHTVAKDQSWTGLIDAMMEFTPAGVMRIHNAAATSMQLEGNSTSNMFIINSTAGVAAPALTTRSVGTKVVLYPSVDASHVDFALGIDSAAMWFSVPDSSSVHKFYAGTTNIFTVYGDGTQYQAPTSAYPSATGGRICMKSSGSSFYNLAYFDGSVWNMLVGNMYSLSGGAVSANTAGWQTLATCNVPANKLKNRSVLRIRASGNCNSTDGVNSVQWRILMNGVVCISQSRTVNSDDSVVMEAVCAFGADPAAGVATYCSGVTHVGQDTYYGVVNDLSTHTLRTSTTNTAAIVPINVQVTIGNPSVNSATLWQFIVDIS